MILIQSDSRLIGYPIRRTGFNIFSTLAPFVAAECISLHNLDHSDFLTSHNGPLLTVFLSSSQLGR